MRHHPADDHVLGLPAFENCEKIGFAVAVGNLPVDNRLAFEMRDAFVNADALGAGNGKGRAGFARFALNVDVMPAMFAEVLQERARLFPTPFCRRGSSSSGCR